MGTILNKDREFLEDERKEMEQIASSNNDYPAKIRQILRKAHLRKQLLGMGSSTFLQATTYRMICLFELDCTISPIKLIFSGQTRSR